MAVQRQWQALLEASTEGTFGMDAEGCCTYMNRRAQDLLGYTDAECLVRSMHEVTHYKRPDGSPYPIEECPIYQTFVSGQGARLIPETLWRKDGSPFSALYSCAPFLDHGRVMGAVVTIVDVSDIKQAEAEREHLLAKLQVAHQQQAETLTLLLTLLRHLPNGSVNVFDRDLRYRLAEGQGLAQVGLSPEMLVGKTPGELFPEEQVQLVKPYYQRAFAGEAVAFDLPLGEHIYLINASPLPGGWDGAEAIIAVAHNVTEQRAEARRQQDFLAMITHDLKSPLTSVRAYAQLMQRRQRYDERAVATIVQQTHYLDRLIDDLTALARLARGELVLEREPLDLVALVREVSSQAQATATHHHLQVVPPNQPITGAWDGSSLTRVLHNLLSNAIKYSPAGGPITVTVTAGADAVALAVQD